MRRRAFLRLSGCGLLGWASGSLPLLSAESNALASKAAEPVVLSSAQLQIVLDGQRGVPFEYRLSNGARLRGDQSSGRVAVAICQRAQWKFTNLEIVPEKVKATQQQADFRYRAMDQGKLAGSFMLRYMLDAATLHVTLEDVQEQNGYELIDVKLPRLVTVCEEDGDGWLAHGDDGGNLAQLSKAKPGVLRRNSFWGNVLSTLPVVMVGTDRALCAQEVTAFMDGTELHVDGEQGRRRVSLGTTKTFRVNGRDCYDMNLGKEVPCVAGNSRTPNLIVGQKSSCRLDFIAARPGATVDWLDGAKLVRNRIAKSPTEYYDNRFVYGIRCDEPTWEKPLSTFQECEQLIQEVAALTDNWAQVVHLWGWQYRGKDTGYPAIDEVDERIGGYDGLMKLMSAGRERNCTVTFSDNYDDAYRSSPAWNPDLIARRPDQELWKSRNWTGEDSYILGMAKYVKAAGLARVDRTCEKYKLRETTHVDVLSYFAVRNDWDTANPASGYKNLVEGRYKILEQFAKHGVDVSSETVRYPFIGKVSFYWTMPNPQPCPFDGKPIPMLPTIYRQSGVWGFGLKGELLDRLLQVFFYNAAPHVMFHAATDRRQITDLFYFAMAPWFRIHKRNVEGYRREGDRTVIDLEGNSRVDINWKAKTYAIFADGAEIARTFATFCPMGDDRIAFYAQQSGELSAALPSGWRTEKIAAFALFTGQAERVDHRVESGKVVVQVPAGRPVLVYRDGEQARAHLAARDGNS
ncbi:MAG TPA: endo-alpha-N-acetylgalactosaminidase family protein [Clostridia bacterium]|nr:endo-alpha-N-acetylgalactosaminidase family protein [Clostridia bacterium]